jgi:uncharacterized membrane protein
MRNSNWTGRFPRTMDEAFGPYASQSGLYVPYERATRGEKITLVVAAAAVALIIWLAVKYG